MRIGMIGVGALGGIYLEKLSRNLPDVRATAGTAEQIPASDESFDMVVAGQAFHWFDAQAALRRRVVQVDEQDALHAVEAEPLPHLDAEQVREDLRLPEESAVDGRGVRRACSVLVSHWGLS